MTEDARAVLDLLAGTRSLKSRQIAYQLKWSTPGAETPWSGKACNQLALDTRRAFRAVTELRAAGLVEERMTGSGSRWKVVR